MSTVVLVSGGMDSVVALHHAAATGTVLAGVSFDYGSKHNHREIPFAKAHCAELGLRHETVPLGFMDQLFTSDLLKSGGEIPDGHYEELSMKQTVVPFRNGIMLAIAAGFAESAGASSLTIAAHSGDHAIYPDCRESFMASMASAITEGTYEKIALHRPVHRPAQRRHRRPRRRARRRFRKNLFLLQRRRTPLRHLRHLHRA